MTGIQYDTNKAAIKPESNGQIADIVEIMKAHPEAKIKIGGYAVMPALIQYSQIIIPIP